MQNYLVLISCKLSNSILTYLERQGYDVQAVLQSCDVPVEFLRDTSYWLQARKMEDFLNLVNDSYLDLPETYCFDVGKGSENFRAWGVLDSVLKMVESPLDIYGHPTRFLSYFISPEPPIDSWKNHGDLISFQIPISANEFPNITSYLAGALEGLPHYMGQNTGVVKWNDCTVSIRWSLSQESLLPAEDLQLRQFNPQWVRTVIDSLDSHQRNLQSRANDQHSSAANNEDIEKFLNATMGTVSELSDDISVLREDFLRLHDYFSRAQQLITFLVHSGRKTKQVDEAMRRMDWAKIQQSYDELVTGACNRILSSRDKAKHLGQQFNINKQNKNTAESAQEQQIPLQ
jgi:hypothetical protein